MSRPDILSVAQPTLSWQAAHEAVGAAARAAAAMGAKVNIAVVDCSGVEAAFIRMNGASLISIDIAKDKAYTAVSFGLPTSQWHEALKSHSVAVQEGIPLRPRMVTFGGGLPIVIDGHRVGGIGVSGGTEEEDEQIDRAGVTAIGIK